MIAMDTCRLIGKFVTIQPIFMQSFRRSLILALTDVKPILIVYILYVQTPGIQVQTSRNH